MTGAVAAATAISSIVAAGSVLDADMGMDVGYGSVQTGPAMAALVLTVKTDGTWTVVAGTGDTLSGTPTSGTWRTGGAGADHEVRFTKSALSNSPSGGNDAPTYTSLASNRSVTVSKTNSAAAADITVDIRRIATTTPVLSETSTFEADGSP